MSGTLTLNFSGNNHGKEFPFFPGLSALPPPSQLLLDPERTYKRLSKFMNALDKVRARV